MDNIQQRREDDTWQTPVDLKGSDSLSSAGGMTIPALSLADARSGLCEAVATGRS